MIQKLFRAALTVIGGVIGYAVFLLVRLIMERQGNTFFRDMNEWQEVAIIVAFVLIFALLFFLIKPVLDRRASKVASGIESDLQNRSTTEIIMGTAGLLIGLILAYLMSQVYNLIPIPLIAVILSIITYVVFIYFGLVIGRRQGTNVLSRINLSREKSGKKDKGSVPKILDTSVIIDGRILDIMKTGFLEGPIVIPEFVLVELRHISDSGDALKRNRGRRGLDVLNAIRDDYGVEIYDTNGDKALEEIPEVDVKLLKLAQRMDGKVVTNDYNLNKVAGVKGVEVLNINELANALKPVVLPGERMSLFLVKEGKNRNQALAYLDDGTMIVVEDGRHKIGENTDVIVTSVLQTSAGRMIFAKLAA